MHAACSYSYLCCMFPLVLVLLLMPAHASLAPTQAPSTQAPSPSTQAPSTQAPTHAPPIQHAPSTHGVPTPHVPLIMHGAPSTYSSCSFYPHMPRHSSCSKNSCFYYSYSPATHALTLMHAPSTHACSSYFLLMLSCILLLILVLCYYSWSYHYLLLRLLMLLLLT